MGRDCSADSGLGGEQTYSFTALYSIRDLSIQITGHTHVYGLCDVGTLGATLTLLCLFIRFDCKPKIYRVLDHCGGKPACNVIKSR